MSCVYVWHSEFTTRQYRRLRAAYNRHCSLSIISYLPFWFFLFDAGKRMTNWVFHMLNHWSILGVLQFPKHGICSVACGNNVKINLSQTTICFCCYSGGLFYIFYIVNAIVSIIVFHIRWISSKHCVSWRYWDHVCAHSLHVVLVLQIDKLYNKNGYFMVSVLWYKLYILKTWCFRFKVAQIQVYARCDVFVIIGLFCSRSV